MSKKRSEDSKASGASPDTPTDAGQPTAERAPTKREQAQADKEDHVGQRDKLSESLD